LSFHYHDPQMVLYLLSLIPILLSSSPHVTPAPALPVSLALCTGLSLSYLPPSSSSSNHHAIGIILSAVAAITCATWLLSVSCGAPF
jgi:hypothetical protein